MNCAARMACVAQKKPRASKEVLNARVMSKPQSLCCGICEIFILSYDRDRVFHTQRPWRHWKA